MIEQAGSICWIDQTIVLVSNKGKNRWVIPKGHLESDDCNLSDRARCEAWEEAGVQTDSAPRAVGEFLYQKRGGVYRVSVFVFDECSLSDSWPESSMRTRVLVEPAKAATMVNEPGLQEILRSLAP